MCASLRDAVDAVAARAPMLPPRCSHMEGISAKASQRPSGLCETHESDPCPVSSTRTGSSFSFNSCPLSYQALPQALPQALSQALPQALPGTTRWPLQESTWPPAWMRPTGRPWMPRQVALVRITSYGPSHSPGGAGAG